jgi:hypothetical protein
MDLCQDRKRHHSEWNSFPLVPTHAGKNMRYEYKLNPSQQRSAKRGFGQLGPGPDNPEVADNATFREIHCSDDDAVGTAVQGRWRFG